MAAEGPKIELSADWLIGEGIALTMIDTVPPDGHIADATISLREDGGFELTVGTAEFGNGTSTVHRQIARRRWRPPSTRSASGNRTPRMAATTPAPMAAPAPLSPDLRPRRLRKTWPTNSGSLLPLDKDDPDTCVLKNDSVICGKQQLSFAQLAEAAWAQGQALSASGTSGGTPRSVAFNVQGFRVAVNKGTGEIKILKSVQAADAGRSPIRCSAAARSRAGWRNRSAPRCTRRW